VPYIEKGDVRIRYEERGEGFPLLLLAPGGLNSRLTNWSAGGPGPTASFDPLEVFEKELRLVAMDQRNAHLGESTGPLDVDDPWGAYLGDQIAVMDHLGYDRFFALGFCIGCSFALGLAEKAPDRVAGIVLCQPIGHRPEDPDVMYESGLNWGKELIDKRPEITMPMVERMLERMYRSPADFVYSVSRDFIASSQTPMLVLPGNDRPHPHDVGLEVAELAPRSETMDPWKQPELIPQTVERIRGFLNAHNPLLAAR
jgi:pimeloyl-ACP methyl ester carboxylesterase